jgi:hypothetical protein
MADEQVSPDPILSQPSPEVPAAPEPAVVDPPKDTEGSLAEHVAQVGPEGRKGRHRAKSQQAGPEDVAQIAEYTKRLRTAEDAIGLKVEQKAGESDRVFQLRRRAEYAEAIVKVKPVPAPPEAAGPKLRPVPIVEPGKFDKPTPKLEDFSGEDDPYAEWVLAKAEHRAEQREFEKSETAKQQAAESATTENHAELTRFFSERQVAFGQRLKALIDAQPEAVAIFEKTKQTPLTDVMHAALLLDPRGEQVMLDVAKNHQSLMDALDQLYLATDGKPVTPELVAMVQRRFHSMTQAAHPTGSAALVPVNVSPAPRPPTPVRTAPMKAADTPPADEDSLAAHTAFYGKKRT